MRTIDVHATSTAELLELAERQLATWTDAARGLVPAGRPTLDSHCHVGIDSDGSRLAPRELVAQLDAARIDAAIVAPLHQPGGYGSENGVIREACATSDGRLLALHRCDPRAIDVAADAAAGLAAGAVGLKWHPRAEAFGMGAEVATRTAAVADEAGVPVLIHAGRGMEQLGRGVVELARRHPRATFVLAHAAISDLAWIADELDDVPNVVFDTSWWRPTDLAVLLSTVDPERVVFGSDPPYGTCPMGVQLTARMARACGWDDAAMAALMGGTAARLYRLAADDAATAGGLTVDDTHMPEETPALRRAGEYLTTAVQIEFAGGDSQETFDLVGCALAVPDEHPLAEVAHLLAATTSIGMELLARDADDARRQQRATLGDDEEGNAPDPAQGAFRQSLARRRGVELLICTAIHLATPAIPVESAARTAWVSAT